MSSVIGAAAAVMAAGAAGGLLRSQYERNHFVTEETVIRSPKIQKPARLVFLSDLHDKEFGRNNECLLQEVRRQAPDAILIGGDTMVAKEGKAKLDVTRRLIAGLSEIGPIYYGNGNHEQRLRKEQETYGELYHDFRKLLRQYGVVYLSNESAWIRDDIKISGLDLQKVYYDDFCRKRLPVSYVTGRLGKAEQKGFQILLAHSPLFLETYGKWGADLSLAGHFHGGTIRLPLVGGVMTPQYQFFHPYCAGTFELEGHYMIVSRGLGTHSVNIRFCNKPQIAAVKLLPESAG